MGLCIISSNDSSGKLGKMVLQFMCAKSFVFAFSLCDGMKSCELFSWSVIERFARSGEKNTKAHQRSVRFTNQSLVIFNYFSSQGPCWINVLNLQAVHFRQNASTPGSPCDNCSLVDDKEEGQLAMDQLPLGSEKESL